MRFAPAELGRWYAAVLAVVLPVAGGHMVWGVVDSAAPARAQGGCRYGTGSKNANHDGSFLVGHSGGEALGYFCWRSGFEPDARWVVTKAYGFQ